MNLVLGKTGNSWKKLEGVINEFPIINVFALLMVLKYISVESETLVVQVMDMFPEDSVTKIEYA